MPRPILGPPAFTGSRRLELPLHARDKGHNGSATWRTRVSATGEVLEMELLESSGSPEIDEATHLRILKGPVRPARNKHGEPIAGVADLWLQYALWDAKSSGVGLDHYRCSDLTREYAWYLEANRMRAKQGKRLRLFVPENVYVGRKMYQWRIDNSGLDPRRIEQQRAEFGKGWARVMAQCRKQPDALMIDLVDNPMEYRLWL